MMRREALLACVGCIVLFGCAAPMTPARETAVAQCAGRPELGRYFGAIDGTFVLLDAQTGSMVCHNPKRAGQRFLPASTFKIPNSIIALDSGVASGPDFALTWDPGGAPRQSWWPDAWARDHTMRTALPNSVVWYYQELARRIGPTRMQAYLDRFDYGNRNISGGIDRFWLTGGLRISAEEQVKFLRQAYFGELGVSPRAIQAVKELLVLEETPAYRLSGKTGWAGFGESDKPQTGWLVGYLERAGAVYFYATNIAIGNAADAKARLVITKSVLEHLGLLDRR